MKKAKFEGKLSLNKETVSRLNDFQMNGVKGGSVVYANTAKCYVLENTWKFVPPCDISIKVSDVKVVIH
jgi:molybdenum cofactor biosynthesis enzyme